MARMHSDGRGSSGSKKPVEKEVPDWVDYGEEEVRELVVDMREQGLSTAEIGLKLRDQYGIPDVKTVTGDKITTILEENDMAPEVPEDLQNLIDKAENIEDHLDENPADEHAERRLELVKAKIRRVAKYHREQGNIPEDWKYEDSEE
jgi:small subunit ribosomal protein S15